MIQAFKLMNDPFVLSRVSVKDSPALQRIAALESRESAVDELFLTLLSRYPSAQEKRHSVDASIEDLAWALINKTDFLFSY